MRQQQTDGRTDRSRLLFNLMQRGQYTPPRSRGPEDWRGGMFSGAQRPF